MYKEQAGKGGYETMNCGMLFGYYNITDHGYRFVVQSQITNMFLVS